MARALETKYCGASTAGPPLETLGQWNSSWRTYDPVRGLVFGAWGRARRTSTGSSASWRTSAPGGTGGQCTRGTLMRPKGRWRGR
eukprot:15421303-Heterocapsa_arctica.AAC.1